MMVFRNANPVVVERSPTGCLGGGYPTGGGSIAGIAQLGERRVYTAQVGGSNPSSRMSV